MSELRKMHADIAARDAELWGAEVSNIGVDIDADDDVETDDYDYDETDSPPSEPPIEHELHAEPGPRHDYSGSDADSPPPEATDGYIAAEIIWSKFWTTDLTARDFALEPLAPRGRSITIVSKAKEGKSELSLWCAVQRARGRKALAQPAGEPVDVLYVDHEMTETDIQERLTDMGIDETVDLSHLHYVLMPSVDKLDTPAGGEALLAHVDRTHAVIVIVDTLSKIVEGKENDSDTWRAYWTHTGQLLHARGITVIALDHSGHTSTRARGSSAKQAIFDVIWELAKLPGGAALRATHRRVGWVPERLAFGRKDDPVSYQANNPTLWPAGVEEAAEKLTDADVPVNGPDATERKARTRLRENGVPMENKLLRAALKWRRDPANQSGAPSGAPLL